MSVKGKLKMTVYLEQDVYWELKMYKEGSASELINGFLRNFFAKDDVDVRKRIELEEKLEALKKKKNELNEEVTRTHIELSRINQHLEKEQEEINKKREEHFERVRIANASYRAAGANRNIPL